MRERSRFDTLYKIKKERSTMNYEKEFELKDPSYRSSTLTNGLARSAPCSMPPAWTRRT